MHIDGTALANTLLEQVATDVARLPQPPRLAAVLIGGDDVQTQESRRFLALKGRIARKVGMNYDIHEFPATLSTRQMRKKIVDISKNKQVSAVIIELPLPSHISTQYVLNAIPVHKDPDVLSQQA